MSAPFHTRPFNLEHARAGAPYCFRDGSEAAVLKWDGGSDEYPLVGIGGLDDDPNSWTQEGQFLVDERSDKDLVMTPLGMIDGKPVFVGDELEDHSPNGWVRTTVAPADRDFTSCRLPARWPVYPETRMSGLDLANAARRTATTQISPGYADEAVAIANAAIRRAIEDGQVVLPDPEARAARDMAIAVAVRDVCRNNFTEMPATIHVTTAYARISNVSLDGVIAGLKS